MQEQIFMGITDDLACLSAMQLSDSLFPTGLFAASNGLESLFLNKRITTVHELIEFDRVCLEQQIGPSDCIVVSNTYKSCLSHDYKSIMDIDSICSSMKTIRETREASFRSGIQLARCVREFENSEILDWYWNEIQKGKATGVYPVSFAICCNALKITREKSILVLMYGFVASITGAALRLGMIQHFDGQKIIHELKPLISRIARESSAKPLEDVWQFSPQMEINQMSHEGMDSKMFIT